MLPEVRWLRIAVWLAVFFLFLGCTMAKAQDQTVGLFLSDPASAEGYTLFAPMSATTTYLIDNFGRLVHSWPSTRRPSHSVYLLENGNLLRTAESRGAQLIAWDGTLLWDFQYYDYDYHQHHDIEPLPNGNVLLLIQERKTVAEAEQAGRNPALLGPAGLHTEYLIEVQPTGSTSGLIVWEWHLWDHFVQDYDPAEDNYGVVTDHPELVDINFADDGKAEWIHANSVAYNADLDQIILSCRNVNEIWIIDHSATTAEAASHAGGNRGRGGDILYRWGNPRSYGGGTADDRKYFYQHDAQWIDAGLPGEGNILVFNNFGGQPEGDYSSVDEIVPPVDVSGNYTPPAPGTAFGPSAQTWIYTSDPPTDFFSSNISGAQRLSNGNTLICEGDNGRFFEVTPEGTTVWEYINPVSDGSAIAQEAPPLANNVFRCYRYEPDYPGLQGKDLTPDGPIEIYPVTISGTVHAPVIPGGSDPVTVTAIIVADASVNTAELWVDAGAGFTSIAMYDDGAHGDILPGDDIFGATIPPQPYATSVSYYIYAEDNDLNGVYDPPCAPAASYRYTVSLGGLDHPAITLFEQQTNYPELTMSVAPTAGHSWSWTASDIAGFSGSPSIWFEYEEDGSGESNEDHTAATLRWLGFASSDWQYGADGTFSLTLSNGIDDDRYYSMQLSVRSLLGDGYTVIDGQTQGEAGVCAPGAEGFTVTADVFDWGMSGTPTSSSLTFDAQARLTGYSFDGAIWTEDGTFRIKFQDGNRPASYIASRAVSLRSLAGDGYTIIDGQSLTQGEAGVSAPGANGFTVTADQFDWGVSGTPTSASLTLNAEAKIAAFTFADALWTEDGTFRVKFQDGNRPVSYVANRAISLRSLTGDGYTVIDGQTQGESGVSAPGAEGFTVTADMFDWGVSSTPTSSSLTLDSEGRVTGFSFDGAVWAEDGTFRIKLKDGDRPAGYLTGRAISLRSLVGQGYVVVGGQTQGGTGVSASGAGGFTVTADQFDWGMSATPSASSLTLDADGRVVGYSFSDAGWIEDGTFRIKLRDGERPASYVTDRAVSLRRIIPNPLLVPFSPDAGSTALEIDGDTGPWDWSDYTDGLAASSLTAPDTDNSPSVTVSWGAGDLVDGESGTGSLTMQRGDDSAPLSVVALPTTVEAPGCCQGRVGDANNSGSDEPTIGDITAVIDAKFITGSCDGVIDCVAEADVNLSGSLVNPPPDCDDITIGDITMLIDYLFITGKDNWDEGYGPGNLAPCP